jgi:hypothetical protein
MGFVGRFIKTIFSPSIPQASAQQPTISGHDLVQSTESAAPEAPLMGGTDTRKRRGIEQLLAPTENIYKGGI